jgi:hypothetical protein
VRRTALARAFFLATRIQEARSAPRAACGRWCSSTPKPTTPDQPAAHTAFYTHWARLVSGEQYGPPIAPFARARCQFSPLLRPYSPGGAARGSHTGQFRVSDLAGSCFIAPIRDLVPSQGRAHRTSHIPSPLKSKMPCVERAQYFPLTPGLTGKRRAVGNKHTSTKKNPHLSAYHHSASKSKATTCSARVHRTSHGRTSYRHQCCT